MLNTIVQHGRRSNLVILEITAKSLKLQISKIEFVGAIYVDKLALCLICSCVKKPMLRSGNIAWLFHRGHQSSWLETQTSIKV